MKSIIYVDQSYLSDLTRARLEGQGHPYWQLYDALLKAVQADKIVCPASPSHYNESQMGSRLVAEDYRTLEQLYCGVEFLCFPPAVNAQATTALYDHLDQAQPPQLPWRVAFNSDPHDHFDGEIQRIDPSGHALLIEELRSVKENHANELKPIRAKSWQAQHHQEMDQIINFLYPMPPEALPFATWGVLEPVFASLLGHEPTWDEKDKFLKSEELRSVPYIDISASLQASMIWDTERQPKGSDLEDVMAAALALPYCDLYTTDGGMKHLIQLGKFKQEHKAEIFSSRETDLSSFVSRVIGILSR